SGPAACLGNMWSLPPRARAARRCVDGLIGRIRAQFTIGHLGLPERTRRCRGDAMVHRRETAGCSIAGVETPVANARAILSSPPRLAGRAGGRRFGNAGGRVLLRRFHFTANEVLCAAWDFDPHGWVGAPRRVSRAKRTDDIMMAKLARSAGHFSPLFSAFSSH